MKILLHKNNLNLMLLGLGLLLGLVSCSTTQVTSTWKSPDVQPATLGRVLVVGIIREADRSLREQMETHLAGDLKAQGYNAVCACEEYGPKAFQEMSEDEIVKKLANQGYDAILTVVLLNKEKEQYYVPGQVMSSPSLVYYDRFGGYYRTVSQRIIAEGYYQEATRYFWESNLYQVPNAKLAYSIQTRSFDPASTSKLAHEYGKLIVQEMIKSGILKK
jgi:hypothetical protein